MKILILHNQLWTQYKSVVFQGIHDSFKNTGNELLVLQTSISEKSRLNIIDFDLANFEYTYPFRLLNNCSLEEASAVRTTYYWLKYMVTFKPDVINLTGYSDPGTLLVVLFAKLLGIKTIMTNESIYSHRLHAKSMKQYLVDWYKSIILRNTDGFLSYGIKSNDYLYRFGISKDRIYSFLNAFDCSKFNSQQVEQNSSPGNENYLLFVGRLSEEKNLTSLLELGRRFKTDGFECKIKIVGDGPEFNHLHEAITSEELPIVLEGAKNWNQLNTIYQSALAFILPSLNETWGMVANEALEMGIPVICSDVCGCADDLVINDFNGLVLNDLNFTDSNNDSTYDKLKNYLSRIMEEGNSTDVNQRVSSIYEEKRLINEFIRAFQLISHN
jgi:glycosyltransferase involved in cell wall biosynthesis